jgi:hypothetical protein
MSNTLKPKVVLVADRTLSGNYKILFEAIFASMQTTQIPEIVLRRFLSPPVKTDALGRAHSAALGLRRLEAALINKTTLEPDDVVCTTPEKLASLIGPWTEIVGFTSSDPLGMGMSNTTTTHFWKGELYTRYWTRQLLGQLKPLREKHRFTVIAGGAGAWQFRAFPEWAQDLPVDVVFEGYFEDQGPQLFTDLLEGRTTKTSIIETKSCVNRIQPIRSASLLGAVELSRGCGRGCRFCSMGRTKMEHVSPDVILSDLETNVSQGVRTVVSGSEDFFRYGAKGIKPDFDALHGLLSQLRAIKGLSFMQIDHGNITSVLQLSKDQLCEIRRLLTWEQPSDYLWVNMGVESANGHLVAACGSGKIAPYQPEDWAQMVRDAADRMTRTGFFPVFSIVLGLPGETPTDVADTITLVNELGTKQTVIFPIFYEPIQTDEIHNRQRFTLDTMRPDHLELYRLCYEINFKRVPKLFWDNQRAGGVSWLKRATLQALGKTEVRTWRKTFKTLKPILEKRQEETSHDN